MLALIASASLFTLQQTVSLGGDTTSNKRKLAEVLGVVHVSGKYHLTDEDFLNEGADQILALGSRVIKVYLTVPNSANPYFKAYAFQSEWPRVETLVDLACTTYFRELFEKPFATYILTAYAARRGDHYWINGITPAQARDEEQQFYDLTRHFLTVYRDTGKTFVLQHWEGDWAVRGSFDRASDPTKTAIDGMIRWLNARQAGVDRARKEVGCEGVQVYHAAEVNLVKACMDEGRPGVTNTVLPHTNVDLVSYSAWDTQGDPDAFRKALFYIARHAPDRPPFGPRNVYVGEFGAPQNEWPLERTQKTVRNVIDEAIRFGCPYIVYWQVYCNELRPGPQTVPAGSNERVRGFWLIRPDGTKAWPWQYLHGLLVE